MGYLGHVHAYIHMHSSHKYPYPLKNKSITHVQCHGVGTPSKTWFTFLHSNADRLSPYTWSDQWITPDMCKPLKVIEATSLLIHSLLVSTHCYHVQSFFLAPHTFLLHWILFSHFSLHFITTFLCSYTNTIWSQGYGTL